MIHRLIPLSSETHSDPWMCECATYGVAGEFSIAAMRFDIRYYIGDKWEPLNVTMDGLRKLRRDPSALATLLDFGVATISQNRISVGARRSYYFFIANEPETENGICADVSDRGATVYLPPSARWKEVGIDWLLSNCRVCRVGRDEFLPWTIPRCKHVERFERQVFRT